MLMYYVIKADSFFSLDPQYLNVEEYIAILLPEGEIILRVQNETSDVIEKMAGNEFWKSVCARLSAC